MPRKFSKMLREYFLMATVFVVLLVLFALFYLLDRWAAWGIF